ncbi:MAG: hypothetical protein NTY02_19260, partial [Acidobacteria bacterium]|nr:hypothetical protein [Acidobacteriota bacterium]
MTRRPTWLVAAGLFIAVQAGVPQASTSRFWQVSTQADLLKGQVERLSIDYEGRLVLGPAAQTVLDATSPFIWSLAPGPDGSVFAGGGNDGLVWRIDRQGTSRIVLDATELEVHALAVGPDGALYAGTSPDGKVYRVDAQGRSSVFFDPDDKYIWSIVFDAQGRMYVGTGDKGLVYRVGPDGKGDVFCKTQATHAGSLVFDRQGQLLVGTESPGRVLRVTPAGKAFVLLDSPYREIRGLRLDKSGAIFAAAVNGKQGAEERAAAPSAEPPKITVVPSVSTEITAITVIDAPPASGSSSPAPRPAEPATAKGAVYRLAPAGAPEIVWESKDDQPFDLFPEDDGSVLVATGNAGKLFRLAGDPWRTMLVTRLGGQQVTAILGVGPSRYFATSNPAKVVRFGDAPATDVFTRSGNTATPDDTWSEWSGPYAQADGDAVKSPAARYLQWKALLKRLPADGQPPVLVSVNVAYLQRNLRPRVTSITVQPPGIVFQKPYPTGEPEIAGLAEVAPEARLPVFSTPLGTGGTSPSSGPALGRRMYQKSLQSLLWRADDDNEDRRQYDVYYR